MGVIVVWSDVVAKYKDAGSSGDANTMDASYILPAESYIKGALAMRYSQALTDAGYVVKDLVIDETYRRIVITKQPKKADVLEKDISRRINDILNGRVRLMDNAGDFISPDVTTLWSNTKDYTPVFGMGDILDMEVDQDQIDDEENERG